MIRTELSVSCCWVTYIFVYITLSVALLSLQVYLHLCELLTIILSVLHVIVLTCMLLRSCRKMSAFVCDAKFSCVRFMCGLTDLWFELLGRCKFRDCCVALTVHSPLGTCHLNKLTGRRKTPIQICEGRKAKQPLLSDIKKKRSKRRLKWLTET